MKKWIALILVWIMLLTLCACSSNESADSLDLETQYYNYAQQCISEGKTDEAKSVLEEVVLQWIGRVSVFE